MNRFEKAAYGGDDEYGEYDRWSDGGPAWGLNKQKMIDMTRLFAAEAARRKAQLQFHSDRYGSDMYSPEEAVKRISAVANDKDLDDVENLPNYYNLQYPLKPRSGILETLRLKSPGPIDDWGPEGHPMEAVNRAIMGMRSRSGSLKKAAAFGAMMGKIAAEIGTPNGAPAAAPKGPSLNSTPPSGLGGNGGGMDLSGGHPKFDQGSQDSLLKGYANFQKNNPSTANVQYPAPAQGGSTRYQNNEQMTQYARLADVLNNKTTGQQVAAMNPGEKMIYDRRSRPSNEQIATNQLEGKVNPNANSPYQPSGAPLSAKNQEAANAKDYTERAYTNRANLRPGSLAAERSSQQNKADEAAGAIPNFVASTAAAGPLGDVLGAGAGYLGGKILPKIAPAFARWAAPVAHDAAHVAGHFGAASLLPAAYGATPTSIKGAPTWLAGKGIHAVEHQLHNVPHALERGKGALEEFLNRSKPAFSGDVTNPPLSGEVANVPRG